MKQHLRRRREQGQTTVEFALAMPFLLMFILFLVDLALLGFSVVSVTNAVREGARCGAVGGSPVAVEQRVTDAALLSGGITNVDVVQGSTLGSDITVSADYEYNWITPVSLVPGISGTTSYSRTSIMRMELNEPDGGYTGTCGGSS